MATSLQSPPSTESDPGVQELTRFIRRARGKFALIIAVCNRADYRDQCIEFLAEQFKGNSSVVALPAGTEDLLIPAKYTAQAGAQLIQLTDLELSTPEDESSLTAVRNLNLHRGDWPTLGCPVILWVAEYLLGILLRRAPDFADWRSGTVVLTPPERSPFVLPERAMREEDPREDGEYNTAAERQARIAELMERLAPVKTEQGIADATDHTQALWMRELATHFILTGQPEEGEQWAAAAIRYWKKAEQTQELVITFQKLAKAWHEIGNLPRALAVAQQAHQTLQKLIADSPASSPQDAWDLATIMSNIGGLLMERGQEGDIEQALRDYERSLEIRELLLRDHPDSRPVARAVTLSLDKLGFLLTKRGQDGDSKKALDCYERSLEMRQRMWEANPQNAQAARDLSSSHEKLGDFFLKRRNEGDQEKALTHFKEGLKMAEALRKMNPKSAQAVRDVAVAYVQVGDVLLNRGQSGDEETAHVYFQRSLTLSERLIAENPQSAQAARDFSVSLGRLGEYHARRRKEGDKETARHFFERSLELKEKLMADNPYSSEAARDIMVSHFKLFHLHREAGDEPKAIEHLTLCFAILNSFALEGRPMDPGMRELHAQLAPMFAKQ